jgi:hypothetical protein
VVVVTFDFGLGQTRALRLLVLSLSFPREVIQLEIGRRSCSMLVRIHSRSPRSLITSHRRSCRVSRGVDRQRHRLLMASYYRRCSGVSMGFIEKRSRTLTIMYGRFCGMSGMNVVITPTHLACQVLFAVSIVWSVVAHGLWSDCSMVVMGRFTHVTHCTVLAHLYAQCDGESNAEQLHRDHREPQSHVLTTCRLPMTTGTRSRLTRMQPREPWDTGTQQPIPGLNDRYRY